MATALALGAMYLIPLAALTWVYTKSPGTAFLLVVIIAGFLGGGGGPA